MFENGKRPHITVVGDLILDRYLIGDATKLNPEQPGVVIRVDKEEDRLGGAAAVAMIAAGLGARVTLAGVIGRDEPGRRFQQLIADHGIEPHLWIDGRPTTWKQRIVARGQLRPDRCDREVTTLISDHAARFLSAVPLGDMVLVSDYGKGICTRHLLKVLGNRARQSGVPILVDPARSRRWADYECVTVFKANWPEATDASETLGVGPLAIVRRLADRFRCHVVVTIGKYGMVCAARSGDTRYLPAEATDVHDVCGAGDTVLAGLAVALLSGKPLFEACKLSATVAAQQVRSIGITRVPSQTIEAAGGRETREIVNLRESR
jgi:D-beta-D-heptose 7-phosphate kinase/D-beta-D-heptose 1-phosphate adenosyltransferase